MVDRILLAVEDNQKRMEPAIEYTVEAAEAHNAEVVLFHVYEPSEFDELLEGTHQESADPAEQAKRNATISMAAATMRDANIEFEITAETGSPSSEITEYVADHDIDQVCIGGRNRSPAGKIVLGSVSQDVLLSVDVPCTLVSE